MNNLKATDLLGLGSASAFILTILYLYGYSKTLGVNLFLYFSLNDYFRLAIEWLPPLIVSGIIGGLLHKFFDRVERGATEEEIAARSFNPQFTRTFRKLGMMLPIIALVALAVFVTLLSSYKAVPAVWLYMVWGAAGAILWMILMDWYIKEPKVIVGWTRPWSLGVILFPALAIVAVSYGLAIGEIEKLPYADVEISLRDQTAPVVGRVLFLLDGYLLLKDQSGNVVAIAKTEVTRVLHLPRK